MFESMKERKRQRQEEREQLIREEKRVHPRICVNLHDGVE